MSTSAIPSNNISLATDRNNSQQVEYNTDSATKSKRTEKISETRSTEEIVQVRQLEQAAEEARQAERAAKRESQKAEEEELLRKALESVESFVNTANKDVDFLVDEDSGKNVVKVIDRESKELIRQFPSDEIISMASKIQELQEQLTSKTGLFLDENV